ncbi:DNA-3-methyladenine glycosylase II [Klenkia soli]|uniref:DNA-3-methyladenine glycosylase II n=1 Tax=Klenkia soli TaxID=1052260 RepID=A0A1H0SFE3_9ACTN|nr:DNA-3-methyladenine glycosylase [Klenkia soli]SDP39896.1 DNA-3-methyladenine glycosylase II [Klenkia soli]
MPTIAPRGPFSLAASSRFLEGFAPAGRAADDGPLRLVFAPDGRGPVTGAAVTQSADGTVRADVVGSEPAGFGDHLARILSLDVDGAGFPAIADRDPVVGRLAAAYPGLRPVGFHLPYEAACWAVVGQRLRITQAAGVVAGIRARWGETVEVAGRPVAAFPAAPVLLDVAGELPLPEVKQERLRGLAAAAVDGRLDGARLRDLSAEEAIAEVSRLAGIGPFSAELVVVRGAGHPDRFPTSEGRLHDSMRQLYGLPDAGVAELTTVAEAWAPYRTWVSVLLRVDREAATGEIARGRRR